MISGVLQVNWEFLGEKVRLVGPFEIFAQDNFFSDLVGPVGQFVLEFCPTRQT